MPRYNVEHNKKWACFSTIVDAFVTGFMGKTEYEEWRLKEYGIEGYKPAEECNKYTIAEAIESASLYHSKDEVIKDLIETGISESESEDLYDKYKIKPEEIYYVNT